MKLYFLILATFFTLFLNACQQNTQHKPYVIGMEKKEGVNPNSMAYVVQDKIIEQANERKKLLELKKLETEADIKMTQIQSQKDLEIAKIDSQTKKEIAHVNVAAKKEDSKQTFYIAIAFASVVVFALLLWFFNAYRNRVLRVRLEKQRLEHELALKAKEIEQQKMDKLLELMANGRLPKEAKSQIVSALIASDATVIEHKESKEIEE